MNLHVVAKGNQSVVEGMPGIRLLQTPEDVVDIIGTCFENQARSVLLYSENLTERFFDLSSGEAGAIVQKFRNYHIRLAVVVSPGESPQGDRFREMVAEERQGGDFRIFDDRGSAEGWVMRD
jgi:hypothetical protein